MKKPKRVHRETNNQKKFFGDNAVYDDYHQVYISEVLFANHNLHINKKREQSLTFCNVHSADANIIVTMKVLFLMCFWEYFRESKSYIIWFYFYFQIHMRQLLFRAFKGMSVHEIGLNGFGVVQIFEFVSLALKMSLIDFNFFPLCLFLLILFP